MLYYKTIKNFSELTVIFLYENGLVSYKNYNKYFKRG